MAKLHHDVTVKVLPPLPWAQEEGVIGVTEFKGPFISVHHSFLLSDGNSFLDDSWHPVRVFANNLCLIPVDHMILLY